MKSYVLVCDFGTHRSKLAAEILTQELKEREIEANVLYCAMPSGLLGRLVTKVLRKKDLTKKIAQAADRLFPMTQTLSAKILAQYNPDPKKIICLNIDISIVPYLLTMPYLKNRKVEKLFRDKIIQVLPLLLGPSYQTTS